MAESAGTGSGDSVGKISLDLEVSSDLASQIGKVSNAMGKKLAETMNGATKNMFNGMNKNMNNSLKSMSSSLKNGLGKMKQSMRNALTSGLDVLKGIEMPSISFPKINIAKPNVNNHMHNSEKTTRGSPVNTEALSSQIDNTAKALDIVNAKIEQQQVKLSRLKEEYSTTFNQAGKNKLEEKILRTESVINSLGAQSDKLGFKLNELDAKFASAGNGAEEAAFKINNLSKKTNAFTEKTNNSLNSIKSSHNHLNKLGSSAKSNSNHMHNMGNSVSMVARQFFTWMIILPLILNALSALGSGLLADLNTNQQFSNSLAQIKTNLMVAFTPIYYAILPAINALMSALATITAYIASFISAIFGKTYQQSYQATQGLINAKEAMGAYGNSAKKAAKDAKDAQGALMGFDEINQLDIKKSDGTDDGGGGGGSEVPQLVPPSMDMSAIDSQLNTLIDNVKKKLKEAADLFKDGFMVGVGDTNFDGIIKAANGIKESLKNIFTDSEVLNSAKEFGKSVIYNLGQVTGAIASIGITIATNLLGGIDLYLQQNSGIIKKYIIDMFNIGSDIATIAGNFATAISNIFSVFRSDTAQQITADLIAIFTNAIMGINEIFSKLARDILSAITTPFTENQELIKTTISNVLNPLQIILGSLADFVTNTMQKINQVYDEKISPLFKSLGDGISSIVTTLLNAYNTYIAPVLEQLAQKFATVMKDHIQPLIDEFIDLIGKVADDIKQLWEKVLVPLIDWIIKTIIPIIAPILKKSGDLFMDLCGTIADVISDILKALGGVIDFLTGVFTGDWKKALTGLQEIWDGIWGAIKSVIDTFDKYLSDVFSVDWTKYFGYFGEVLNGFSKSVSEIWTSIKDIFTGINEFISGVFTGDWKKAWTGVRDIFKGVFEGIDGLLKVPMNAVIGLINGAIDGINDIKVDIPKDIPGIGGKHIGFSIGHIPYLAKGGIIDSPTLAMVGESGKEAVVPLENNTGWMDKISESVSNAVIGAMSVSNSNRANNSNQLQGDIVLQVDGTTFARIIRPLLDSENNRQGNNMIIKTV